MTKKQRIFDSVINCMFCAINAFIIFMIQKNDMGVSSSWFFIVGYTLVISIFICAQLAIMFNFESINKICLMINIMAIILLTGAFFLHKYDLLNKFSNIQELQEFISDYGSSSAIIFITLQFLQVTVLPIPSTITIVAGVALFGMAKAVIYSCIGIITGSMFAFFLGRIFGVKLIVWICGESAFKKYQEFTYGKDRLLLFFMFLLPFFPDDLLCMIAGITTMKYSGFFAMQIIVRPIGILFTAGVFTGISSIPFAGWGILFWIVAAIAFVAILVVLWKYGNVIQSWFEKVARNVEQKINKIFKKKDNETKIASEQKEKDLKLASQTDNQQITALQEDLKKIDKSSEDIDYRNR